MTATLLDVSGDHYIGGRRVGSEAKFETRNPYTGEVLAEVSRADASTVDLAGQEPASLAGAGGTSLVRDVARERAVAVVLDATVEGAHTPVLRDADGVVHALEAREAVVALRAERFRQG